MRAPNLHEAGDDPHLAADDIVVLHDVAWDDYQRIDKIRNEKRVPRLTYCEGVLELLTPSLSHELLGKMIGRLVDAYCVERGIGITACGSWTQKSKRAKRGAEADECYVLGDWRDEPKRCDLAIEVVWTRRAINKLDVYNKLGVKEVWIWQKGKIAVYALRGPQYVRITRSALLPDLDLDQLLQFVDIRPMTRAIKEYVAALGG
jgi:Uma2 family endonuclease